MAKALDAARALPLSADGMADYLGAAERVLARR